MCDNVWLHSVIVYKIKLCIARLTVLTATSIAGAANSKVRIKQSEKNYNKHICSPTCFIWSLVLPKNSRTKILQENYLRVASYISYGKK